MLADKSSDHRCLLTASLDVHDQDVYPIRQASGKSTGFKAEISRYSA
jgi:hypothetical protein